MHQEQQAKLDCKVVKAEHKDGIREITEVELYGVSLISPQSAYPLLRGQLARPQRRAKAKSQRWLKQG